MKCKLHGFNLEYKIINTPTVAITDVIIPAVRVEVIGVDIQ
jgi:hypothetical protein